MSSGMNGAGAENLLSTIISFKILAYDEALGELHYHTIESRPYGHTYGEWTAEWWRWFLLIPKSSSPAIDESGIFASKNQTSEYVWFLAGTVASEDFKSPERFCKIPAARSILLPVINCEANSLECPQLTTDRELMKHVEVDENTIVRKECDVDGKPVPAQRVKSDPFVFEVTLVEGNVYGAKGGMTNAAAEGYWVFLKPLPLGEHYISFRGSCESGRLNSGANFRLEIV